MFHSKHREHAGVRLSHRLLAWTQLLQFFCLVFGKLSISVGPFIIGSGGLCRRLRRLRRFHVLVSAGFAEGPGLTGQLAQQNRPELRKIHPPLAAMPPGNARLEYP